MDLSHESNDPEACVATWGGFAKRRRKEEISSLKGWETAESKWKSEAEYWNNEDDDEDADDIPFQHEVVVRRFVIVYGVGIHHFMLLKNDNLNELGTVLIKTA